MLVSSVSSLSSGAVPERRTASEDCTASHFLGLTCGNVLRLAHRQDPCSPRSAGSTPVFIS